MIKKWPLSPEALARAEAKLCPTCQEGSIRGTTSMVCPTCGRDYTTGPYPRPTKEF